MSGNHTTARPFLISGESGSVHGVPEFSDRPPRAFSGSIPPPPDNPWFVRLADWPSAPTEPRPGSNQSADGGTIFFEHGEELESELGYNPQLGHEYIGFEPENQPRVVLWMRDGDSTLRSVTVGEGPAKRNRRMAEMIEFPSEENPENPQVLETTVARPLEVWTLWTSPAQNPE